MNLANGEALQEANPDTFVVPPRKLRVGMEVGDHAKLIFDDAERMWVKITKCFRIDEKVVYHGELANEPAVVDMKLGDNVVFEPHHIVDIYAKG